MVIHVCDYRVEWRTGTVLRERYVLTRNSSYQLDISIMVKNSLEFMTGEHCLLGMNAVAYGRVVDQYGSGGSVKAKGILGNHSFCV